MGPYFRIGLLSCLLTAAASAAPTAGWVSPSGRIVAGEPHEIRCRSEWNAADPAPHVLPPVAVSIDWGSLELRRAESGFDGGIAFVDQIFEVTAPVAGIYTLPSIEVAYKTVADEEPMVAITDEATVTVAEARSPYVVPGIAAAATAVVLGLVVALRFRPKSAAPETSNESRGTDARSQLTRAHVARVEADFYGCYQALAKAAELAGDDEALVRELTARAEAAGFANERPDDTLLESDFRSVEHLIKHAEHETET